MGIDSIRVESWQASLGRVDDEASQRHPHDPALLIQRPSLQPRLA